MMSERAASGPTLSCLLVPRKAYTIGGMAAPNRPDVGGSPASEVAYDSDWGTSRLVREHAACRSPANLGGRLATSHKSAQRFAQGERVRRDP